jgi:hypothetical protein
MKKLIIVLVAVMFIAGSSYAAKSAKKAAAVPTATVVIPTPVPTPTLTVMGKIKAKIKGLFAKKDAAVPVTAPAAVTETAK